MADHLTVAGRARVMASIRSKDTKPELALRHGLRACGATGYRVHVRELPGKPDVAFTRWKLAIFVDGAFWHGHPEHFHPERASDYWRAKIARTKERDRLAALTLNALGWRVMRFWDFQVRNELDSCLQKVITQLTQLGWDQPQQLVRPRSDNGTDGGCRATGVGLSPNSEPHIGRNARSQFD